MRVLFAGFKYEYGKPEWGLSNIEYQNFFGTLEKMQDIEASFFAVDEVIREVGRDEMNQRLINAAREQQPDLLFTMIFQGEIKKETIKYITEKTGIKTFNWFTDDHWRLPVYSRFWAPLFTLVGTTDSKALEKYRRLGINNVIKTQWGVNQYLYRPVQQPATSNQQYHVTFVGKKYGNRGKYIKQLKSAGLLAQGFGKGWSGGVVDFGKMLEIFSFSKINLNFTESPYTTLAGRLKFLSKFIIRKELGKYRTNFQFPISNFQSFLGAQRNQIKARTFEIPATGGFLMTQNADNLADYYLPGKEAIIWNNFDDLLEKCKYYLQHEQERQKIARAGFERTMKEHTYEHRFLEIFKILDLT